MHVAGIYLKTTYIGTYMYFVSNTYMHAHWRRTGLNSMGASISTTSGQGKKRGTLICIISGQGRKTVGASAPTAPISSAPLIMGLHVKFLIGYKS